MAREKSLAACTHRPGLSTSERVGGEQVAVFAGAGSEPKSLALVVELEAREENENNNGNHHLSRPGWTGSELAGDDDHDDHDDECAGIGLFLGPRAQVNVGAHNKVNISRSEKYDQFWAGLGQARPGRQ